MTDLLQTLRDLWWLLVAVVGMIIRVEVGQALNRANIRALWARRSEDRASDNARHDQLHRDMTLARQENREDFKAVREAIDRLTERMTR